MMHVSWLLALIIVLGGDLAILQSTEVPCRGHITTLVQSIEVRINLLMLWLPLKSSVLGLRGQSNDRTLSTIGYIFSESSARLLLVIKSTSIDFLVQFLLVVLLFVSEILYLTFEERLIVDHLLQLVLQGD